MSLSHAVGLVCNRKSSELTANQRDFKKLFKRLVWAARFWYFRGFKFHIS